jgi:hypothetical protein
VIFFGTGINPNVCFLGGMGGRTLIVSQSRKVGFFDFSRNYFFGGVEWRGWKKGVGIFCFCLFFVCDMVT